MKENLTYTYQNEQGQTMLVEETVYPSMCAEFDPNGTYTIGYQFFLIDLNNLVVSKMEKEEVKEFYKTMKSRNDRISLYYLIKNAGY